MKRKQLILLRKQHRMSQSQVASILGIHTSAYSRIENGKASLTETFMVKLCGLYRCPPEQLIDPDRLPPHLNKPCLADPAVLLQFLRKTQMEQEQQLHFMLNRLKELLAG